MPMTGIHARNSRVLPESAVPIVGESLVEDIGCLRHHLSLEFLNARLSSSKILLDPYVVFTTAPMSAKLIA